MDGITFDANLVIYLLGLAAMPLALSGQGGEFLPARPMGARRGTSRDSALSGGPNDGRHSV